MFHDVYQAVCSESRSRVDHSHWHPPKGRVEGAKWGWVGGFLEGAKKGRRGGVSIRLD